MGKPYEIPDGLCIDTLAYFTGILTAYNVTQDVLYQTTLEYEKETVAR